MGLTRGLKFPDVAPYLLRKGLPCPEGWIRDAAKRYKLAVPREP